MIIGYEITGYDNGSYMTGSCDKLFASLSDIPKCNVCGYRTDYRYTNQNFALKQKNLDYSSTYDGITIVSLKFKEFCLRYGYTNLEFVQLKKAPNFYQLYIKGNVIEFKAKRKESFCSSCEQYESIIGPSIKIENFNQPLDDGFYQSDLWFASGNEKSPVIIVGPKTIKNMELEKFNNLSIQIIEKL